jgi:hypothetical protein
MFTLMMEAKLYICSIKKWLGYKPVLPVLTFPRAVTNQFSSYLTGHIVFPSPSVVL